MDTKQIRISKSVCRYCELEGIHGDTDECIQALKEEVRIFMKLKKISADVIKVKTSKFNPRYELYAFSKKYHKSILLARKNSISELIAYRFTLNRTNTVYYIAENGLPARNYKRIPTRLKIVKRKAA